MDDLYIPAASTLRTITRDLVTFRTRDIKPGEDVESIWDEIERRPGHVLNPRGETLETQIAEDFPQHVFYNEADVLEDAVLFPEEMAEKRSKSLYSGKANDLESFVSSGPAWE